jgi:predicted transcriptional regulator
MGQHTKIPCELVIWYVLPDLRREIARYLIDHYDLKQKEVAEILGVTPAAINQYLSSKRGGELLSFIKNERLKKEFIKEIQNSAIQIFNDNTQVNVEICRICGIIKNRKIINEIYKKYEGGNIPESLIFSQKQYAIHRKKKDKCSKCKTNLQYDWIACPNCGKKIKK